MNCFYSRAEQTESWWHLTQLCLDKHNHNIRLRILPWLYLLSGFLVFFLGETDFRPKTLFGKTYKCLLLRNSGQDQVRCQYGSFFCGLGGPTNFRWPQSKIKVTYTSDWALAQNGQKTGVSPGKWPIPRKRNFFGGDIFVWGSPGCIGDMPIWQKITIQKQKNYYWSKISKFRVKFALFHLLRPIEASPVNIFKTK